MRDDRLAQEKFYRHFYPSMFCLCKKFFQDDHAVLEAVNDGMLKVFNRLKDYHPDKGALFNWVYTVVRNTALDKLKTSVKVPVAAVSEEEVEIPTGNILEDLEWRDVYHYLDLLPPATRAVFSLFYLEHFNISAITKQLQIAPGTVKWQLSEGRRLLHPVLKKHFTI